MPFIIQNRCMKPFLNLSASLAILREKKKRRVYSMEEPTCMEIASPIKEDLPIGLLDGDAIGEEYDQQCNASPNEGSNASSTCDTEVHTFGIAEFSGENPKCSISSTIDSSLQRYLIGKGKPIETIERETETKVKILPMQEANGESVVVVEGYSDHGVQEALKLVQELLNEAIENRLQYTHFVSLPLAIHPALVQKISNFQESILASNLRCEGSVTDTDEKVFGHEDVANETSTTTSFKSTKASSGIEKSIFVKPATFHLTVLMLKLWSEERVKAAVEVLKGVEAPVHAALDGQPVAVRLVGLACMRGVPSKAHVLYACIDETDQKHRLIVACQVIINAFMEAGLVLEKDRKQSLKLHATVINTTQRKKKKGKFKKLAFDATDIIAKYGSEEWGEYPILEAHLSQRFKYDERGYYHCCGAISFP